MVLLYENSFEKDISTKTKNIKVCLNMIVKNESKIILRMLDSIYPIIDMICITDTGSDDNTIELIKDWAEEKEIPYAFYFFKFTNFSESRSFALENSMNHFKAANYIFLGDADFVIEIDSKFRKNFLSHDKYTIVQYNKNMSYDNIRLLKNQHPWKYFTPTHEFCACPEDYEKENVITLGKIKSIKIKDLEDGGSKENKIQRDKGLLKDYIKKVESGEHPKDFVYYRSLFYLAQTYKDMKKIEKAIKFYNLRASKKGLWDEELYFCYYQISICYEVLFWKFYEMCRIKTLMKGSKLLTEKESNLLQIFEKDPIFNSSFEEINRLKATVLEMLQVYAVKGYEVKREKSESICKLIGFYISIGEYREALKFTLLIRNNKLPEKLPLFVEERCYDYLIQVYFIISVLKIKSEEYFEEALNMAETFISRNDVPAEYIKVVEDLVSQIN